MKNLFVKYYDPSEVMDITPETTEGEIVNYCFRACLYKDPGSALMAYANTPCTWSTLLDESTDINKWIASAWSHIKENDIDWLENNFT